MGAWAEFVPPVVKGALAALPLEPAQRKLVAAAVLDAGAAVETAFTQRARGLPARPPSAAEAQALERAAKAAYSAMAEQLGDGVLAEVKRVTAAKDAGRAVAAEALLRRLVPPLLKGTDLGLRIERATKGDLGGFLARFGVPPPSAAHAGLATRKAVEQATGRTVELWVAGKALARDPARSRALVGWLERAQAFAPPGDRPLASQRSSSDVEPAAPGVGVVLGPREQHRSDDGIVAVFDPAPGVALTDALADRPSSRARAGFARGLLAVARPLSKAGLVLPHLLRDARVSGQDVLVALRPPPTEGVKQAPASGGRLGELAYRCPERLDRAVSHGDLADVYEVAAVLFHVLTGRPPFVVTTTSELYEAKLKGEAPEAPELDPPLAAVLGRCLARAPEDRFGDLEAAKDAMMRAMRTL